MNKKGIDITVGKIITAILIVLVIFVMAEILPLLHSAGNIFARNINDSNNNLNRFISQIGILKTKNEKTTGLGVLTPKVIEGKTYYFSFLCNLATGTCDKLNATIKDDTKKVLKCNGKTYTLFDNNTMFCCNNLMICSEAYVDNDFNVHYNAFALHGINENIDLQFKEGTVLLFNNEKYKIILNDYTHPVVEKNKGGTATFKKYYNFLIITPNNKKVGCSANLKKKLLPPFGSYPYCVCTDDTLGFKINIIKKFAGQGCRFKVVKGKPIKGET